ncbi:hypothetical protein LCGC14_1673290, partial [marine sediment metagenome]
MNDKHEKRIIKELQKRHDAGKERGDDRLFLDAIELIEQLTRPTPAVGQDKITQRCIDRLKHVENMLRSHHAGRKGILSIADGIKQTLNVAKADIQAASIKPASPWIEITPEAMPEDGEEVVATDGRKWYKMKMFGSKLSFSGSHSFDAAV